MTTLAAQTATTRALRRPRRIGPAQVGLYVVLVALALLYIYPFLVQLATMFKTDVEATQHPLTLWPATWTTAAFSGLFVNTAFPRWFANSVVVTAVVTVGRVMFDSMAGYALARLHFRGRAVVFAGLIAIMSVPMVVLLIPRFLILTNLGLYDTYAGMIIPLLGDAAGVFIMKNFFESVPVAIEEAARIDGAGVFRTFWSVVLPMARPALITIIILSFQGSWNEFAHFIVSSQNPALSTLTRGVGSLVSGQLGAAKQYPLKLAAATIMTLPVIVVFFIFQRRIMNVGSGAVKE